MTATALCFPYPDPPAPGAAVEVAPGILWLRLPLPMALDHVNLFALDEGDGWTLIDTGIDTPAARAAMQAALDGPLGGRPVARVLVTHHHPDHVGLAGWFQAQGADLMVPRTGWLLARMLRLDVEDCPAPQAVALWRLAGMSAPEISRRMAERPFNFADCVTPLPLGYTRITDGQVLHLGGRDWTVRMGDGHAPEHATLWSGDLVIGGDQFLPGISPNLGVWPTEPAADPLGDWLAACARLAPFADDAQLVLPGHKRPYRGLPLRLAQMVAHHHTALDRLTRALAVAQTAAQVFDPLFGRPIGRSEYGLALAESLAHLNHLLAAGRVRRAVGPEGAWLWQAI